MLARRAMQIASEVCVFTNDRLTIETIESDSRTVRLSLSKDCSSSAGSAVASTAQANGCSWTVEHSQPVPLRCCPAARPLAQAARFADCTPLAPVKVDAEPRHPHGRRAAAVSPLGLRRPRRAARRQAAGAQLRSRRRRDHAELGHARSLPTELGLPGHSGPVAVLGSGVMGLSTARLVQEAGFPGHDLRRRASARHDLEHRRRPVPPVRPVPRRRPVTPEFMAQFARALDYSWRRFQIMVGDDYGIRWLPTYVESDGPEAKAHRDLPADQPRARAGRASVPARQRLPLRHHVRRDRPLPSADDPRRADRRRQDRGSAISRRRPTSPRCPRRWCSTAPALARASCSATGAQPARGQLAILSRSRRCATPIPARRATCSRGPTGSSSAARSSSTNGDRRREPADHRAASSIRQKRFFDGFRCTA